MNRGPLSLSDTMTKSAGLGVDSLPFRDCTAYETGRGRLDPAEDQIGQYGRHLCGIAEGWEDIILVILPGVTAKRRQKTGSKRVGGNMYARNHDDLLTAG
jgi:hypothetical protein